MRELVEAVVRQLVTAPEHVTVTETRAESMILLEVRVAKHDIGRVIGKDGRTAHALRTLIRAIAARMDEKVTLEIVESVGPG